MASFKIPAALVNFSEVYPKAQEFRRLGHDGGELTRRILAQQWLSEGIPWLFRDYPALFEYIRIWLAQNLNVHAKQINVSGSSRIGTSLSPQKLGNPFNDNSDLDLFVVSESLFAAIKNDFNTWEIDYGLGKVKPQNDREKKFWDENKSRGIKLIYRGFIDQKMIPNRAQYKTTQMVSNLMWLLISKMSGTTNAPNVKKASIRCYRSWESFTRQMDRNLL